jgi:hypothetical protein
MMNSLLTSIRAMHLSVQQDAGLLKLKAFTLGLYLAHLKVILGVAPGNPAFKANSATVAELGDPELEKLRDLPWEEVVEQHLGMTYSTSKNYLAAYQNVTSAHPKLAKRMVDCLMPEQKALPETALLQKAQSGDLIPEQAKQDFLTTLDPWSLSDLYEKPLKRAKPKSPAHKSREQIQAEQTSFEFYQDSLIRIERRGDYLMLPRHQREALLGEFVKITNALRKSLAGRKD